MLSYLGRYTHRIAISNPRLMSLDNGRVAFRYRDYVDGRKEEVMRLDALDFIGKTYTELRHVQTTREQIPPLA